MKKFLKWFAGIILILIIVYFMGPKPASPGFENKVIDLPQSLNELEKQIVESEKQIKGIKPDNEARIVWADTSKKEKTKIAFLYLHGFSASQGEGAPIHQNLAKKYHANLYLSRLEEHGIELGDSTMLNLTAEKYMASAQKALEIARKLGDEVIIIGTSTGGALAIYLASRNSEIKAIALFSPYIRLHDAASEILDNHWGLQIGRLASGGETMKYKAESADHAKYWQLEYRVEAVVALQNLISNTMQPETYPKIKCPVFLAYYYKNETEQDQVVSVPAMLEMFENLGTPADLKRKMSFPNTGNHVISSPIRSKDWQSVENETDKFLSEIVKL